MMSKQTRLEYLKEKKARYLKADKQKRSEMLDDIVDIAGYNRKYATRILSAKVDLSIKPKVSRKKRKCYYDCEVIAPLRKIWEVLDYPCGKRLEPEISNMLEVLERCQELTVSQEVKKKLLEIKARTIDRKLKREKEIQRINFKRKFATTKPGTLKSKIPTRKGADWNENKPGFTEIDTVAHNGGDPSGEFIYTLNCTDIYSGWDESAAGLGKSDKVVIKDSFQGKIIPSLPFKLRGVDGDSGSEIINILLYNYCQREDIVFTRSRPYHSNDGAHVEEKNWTYVRKLIGYGRLDTEKEVDALNDLYRNELRLYVNFFQPHMKCIKKTYTGSRCKREYEIKTPYQFLMESKDVPKETKQRLKRIYLSLNPVELKKSIDKKLDAISKLSNKS